MTTSVAYVREMDRVATEASGSGSVPLDVTTHTGEWVSGFALPGGMIRVRSHVRDGVLQVGAIGRSQPRAGDWGDVVPELVFAHEPTAREAFAVFATFDDGKVRSQLQTFLNHGVQVIHAFHDAAGYRPYYTREFFLAARDAADDGRATSFRDELPAQLKSGHTDPADLVGTWENQYANSTGIPAMECVVRGGELFMRVLGGPDGQDDWGERPTTLYADSLMPELPPAFFGVYDHGFMRMHLQGRMNRGILVLHQYAEFVDGSGRSNCVQREFYRRRL